MPFLVMALTLAGARPGASMEEFIRRAAADEQGTRRYYDLPLSRNAVSKMEALYKDELKRLDGIKFGDLDQSGKVDWLLSKNHFDSALRDLRTRAAKDNAVRKLIPYADKITALEEARWTLEPLDPERAAGLIEEIRSTAADSFTKNKAEFEKKKLSAPEALRAAKALGSLRDTFKRWYDHYNGYKPLFSWWCEKPYSQASAELAEDERILREDYAGQKGKADDPLVGDPIGKDRLDDDLKREMIGSTPDQLIAAAQKEYDWCLKQAKAASKEMGCGDDWKKALEQVRADHVDPGEQDELIMAQGREAVKFVEDHDLVSLDPLVKETWRVNMLTAEQQKNWPFAFYGGQHMATSYPVPEMDHSTKLMSMRGNNKHFMRAVTHHELIPGHHLQGYMAERFSTYREIFTTPFFIEGWALHWEMLLWDLGFAQSPEDKLGMLFWRMHRCARIVVSLKFHLGQMSPAEMVDYLVENVGHERWTATSEVRRYVGDMYSPLYQCAYMIGGLQLRSIYKDHVPSKMTPREFHDRVLKLGSIPMEMVRATLTDSKLSPSFQPSGTIRASFD